MEVIRRDKIEKQFNAQLEEWLGGLGNKNVQLISQTNEETWYSRIYLVIYNEDDKVNINLIRLFTPDENKYYISVDFAKEYPNKEKTIVDSIMDAMQGVIKAYEKVR